jgi:hypothetical protein
MRFVVLLRMIAIGAFVMFTDFTSTALGRATGGKL